MMISGFTVVRNAVKYNYPILEAIKAILPICDEFVVGVGESEDDTLKLIQSIDDPKIKIFETQWDLTQGPEVLSFQTNLALERCKGDWAFYVQADELIHEKDLSDLKKMMEKHVDDLSVDALRFCWLHFYGSYYRYRVDSGWFQKQDRIVRNNGTIESFGDAYAFRRKDGKPLGSMKTNKFLYHYGWVHSQEIMNQRRANHMELGFELKDEQEVSTEYEYGNLNRFPAYFGTHPSVMDEKVSQHVLSQVDLKDIGRRFWWHPLKWFKVRFKTGKRVREKIQ